MITRVFYIHVAEAFSRLFVLRPMFARVYIIVLIHVIYIIYICPSN